MVDFYGHYVWWESLRADKKTQPSPHPKTTSAPSDLSAFVAKHLMEKEQTKLRQNGKAALTTTRNTSKTSSRLAKQTSLICKWTI
mmetsp:Transcript_10909/g.19075  ORF Transcript_10909/g.19075 Transcript_10909/m.19075 type:complete len:85 (+) Transcript_10909:3-257(+)